MTEVDSQQGPELPGLPSVSGAVRESIVCHDLAMTSQQYIKSSQNCATPNDNTIINYNHNNLAHTQGFMYGQSFSGSETDVSTSTENLSPEERYALEHTQRQEPQGQENVGSTLNNMASSQLSRSSGVVTSGTSTASTARSNDCNASISSSTNTLIIHNSVSDDLWNYRWTPGGYSTPMAGRKSMSSSLLDGQERGPPLYNSQIHPLNMESLKLNSSLLNSSTLDPSAINSNLLASSLNSSILDSSALAQKASVPSYLSQNNIPGSPKFSSHAAMKYQTATDLPDIPSSYLDQSEVLKHLLKHEGKGSGCSDQSASSSNSGINLATEGAGTMMRDLSRAPLFYDLDCTVNYDLMTLPPPPAYPVWRLKEPEKHEQQGELVKHGMEKSHLSKSQPDLTKLNNAKEATSPKELLSQRVVSGQTDIADSPMQEMADILVQENSALKMEVDMYHRKVAKLQRFEMEIIKVHEAHEALVKSSERREHLERLARHKLHAEVKRLTELNADLKDQVDVLSTQIANRPLPTDTSSSDALRKELNKRDLFIAQLVSQNKELIAAKERQEIELTAQRQTLNEQRTHIDILDSALTNAQANVVKLEEELRKKQNLVEQAGQLKRLLVSLQLAADRREQSENNLRHKLEKEIEQLRLGTKQDGPVSKLSDLRREIREKDEKIMILEGEVTKWEQRYLQESAMRQLAIEAASMPKDAKIAALEKTSQESERHIAQAKSDKLRQMDELHTMSKKQAEYEARNRELESLVAERDAMIRVLQRRAEEKEALYQKALLRKSLNIGKSLDGRSSISNSSMVHSTQASTAHSHSSSGAGGAGGGSSAPGTPRRDEELGCAPPIPPFPSMSHTSVSASTTKSNAINPYLDLASNSLTSACIASTSSASSTSSVSMGQESQACGRLSGSRDAVDEKKRVDSCGGASQSSGRVPDLDSLSADDLLVDVDDGMHGKLRVVCFPGLAHPSSAAGEGTVSQPLLARVEPHPSLLLPSQHLTSDQSHPGLNRGMDHTSLVHTHTHNDVPALSCPPYDPPPSYPLEMTNNIPPPTLRDMSSMATAQSQLGHETALQAVNLRSTSHVRGNPPPYHGHHEVLSQQFGGTGLQSSPVHSTEQIPIPLMPGSPPMNFNRRMGPKMSPSAPNLSTDMPVPRPPMCHNPHHPTVACRKCNSVRSSNRQNAAILVRRANSSAGHTYRNSAPLVACQGGIDTDDAPSILARLRREWEMGNIPSCGNSSLPQSLSSETDTQQLTLSSGAASRNNNSQNSATTDSSVESSKDKLSQRESPSQQNATSKDDAKDQHQKDHSSEKVINNHEKQSQSLLQRSTSSGNKSQKQQTVITMNNSKNEQVAGQKSNLTHTSITSSTHVASHTQPTTTAKPSFSTRVQNLFSSPLNLSDVPNSNANTICDAKNHTVFPINNKVESQNQVNKKNDINQLNNNQDAKMELIILEDTDQLKTSKDSTKPLQDII
ncbi:angiomotin-like protein 1 isoform X3 [Procambarus clarkii]|uniref:angiomotin-like protein 1 isoform X3 n=2 Tax=Procambarus clarkii TaxID=6728 RepID=UPI0037437C06